jgi:hypothetical protein
MFNSNKNCVYKETTDREIDAERHTDTEIERHTYIEMETERHTKR